MAQRATSALADAVPCSCVRGARGRSGGSGPAPGFFVFPVRPLPPRVPCAACGGSSRPRVPYPRPLVRNFMQSVRSAGLVRLLFWYSPRVLCVCVRSRSRGVRALPPSPSRCGARTSRGSGAGGWQGRSTRSVPFRVSCLYPVRCLACLGGGVARSRSPLAWHGLVCPLMGGPARPGRSGAGGGGGRGGRPVCRPPRRRGRGAPRGGGLLYLVPSLCLPWTGTKAGVIGVAQFMEGVASTLLRFVFPC